MAAENEISIDIAVVAVLSALNGIFILKKWCWKPFLVDNIIFLTVDGLGKSYVKHRGA